MPLEQRSRGQSALLAILLLLFVLAAVYAADRVRELRSEAEAQSAENPPQENWTWERPADFDAARNVVDASKLAPVLLDDREATQRYLDAFPFEEYRVFEIAGVGRFCVDEGPDLIKGFLRRGLAWESRVVTWIQRLAQPGSTMIDVGAHIGTHTLSLARVAGSEGRVYAFEPQLKLFRELSQNLVLNQVENVVPLRFALGEAPAVIEMNPATQDNEGATSVGQGGDRAEVRTLDSFGFENVSLIKIDVEGMEGPVLRGAKSTILKSRPALLVEIEGGYTYELAPPEIREKIRQTGDLILSMGYRFFRVDKHNYVCIPTPADQSRSEIGG